MFVIKKASFGWNNVWKSDNYIQTTTKYFRICVTNKIRSSTLIKIGLREKTPASLIAKKFRNFKVDTLVQTAFSLVVWSHIVFCKRHLLLWEYFECQELQRWTLLVSSLSSLERLHTRGRRRWLLDRSRYCKIPHPNVSRGACFCCGLIYPLSSTEHHSGFYSFSNPFKFKRHGLSNFGSPKSSIHRLGMT